MSIDNAENVDAIAIIVQKYRTKENADVKLVSGDWQHYWMV